MYPFEFEILWRIRVDGPLTGSEISCDLNNSRAHWNQTTAIDFANQLRSLTRRGLLQHDNGRPRIYRLTARGQELVDA